MGLSQLVSWQFSQLQRHLNFPRWENTKLSNPDLKLTRYLDRHLTFIRKQLSKRARTFPGGDKYNLPVGGHSSVKDVLDDLMNVYDENGNLNPADFTYFAADDGYDWVSVFGVSNVDFQNQRDLPSGGTMRMR